MKNSESFPLWIKLGLGGIKNRKEAVISFWFFCCYCIVYAFAFIMLGLIDSKYFIGLVFVGLAFLLSAVFHWNCIRWIDQNSKWGKIGKSGITKVLMINKINFKLAVNTMLVIATSALVYHLLIVTQIIPYNITWGGRLDTLSKMYVFEAISITINLLIMAVIATKGGYLKAIIPGKIVTVLLWALVVIFSLNTIGNVFAKTLFEALVFTPITLVSAIFCYRMVIE